MRLDENGSWQFARHGSMAFYRHAAWSHLRHGIFTRLGGVSCGRFHSLNVGGSNGDDPAAVRENHRRVYHALEVDGHRAATAWLVHSTDVLTVNGAPNSKPLPKADGLITNRRGLPLVMRFADCVPLLLYDPVKGAIGLGHAGWRGTVQGMASSLVSAMNRSFGSRPDDIQALIGPAISGANYPVGGEVVDLAVKTFGANADVIWRDPRDGETRFDLWRANELDLQRAGVAQIETLRLCTGDNTDLFFSHRAEQGRTGRFGVVICL